MMDEPMRKVMDLPARTSSGLVAKAQLVRMELSEMWEKPAVDLEWKQMKIKALVDAVLAFGVDR
jgi:hypothetical protein